jgi:hypothetical protein
MKGENEVHEDNLGRVLSTAYSRQARPRAHANRATLAALRRLHDDLYGSANVAFPDSVLVLLSAFLGLSVLLLAARDGAVLSSSVAGMAAAALVACNLAVVPIAALIIIVRRRHV